MEQYRYDVSEIKLIPSGGGVFEVTVNDKLVFSKKQTERHAEPGEVPQLIKKEFGF
ncbi:MAG: SelT/SelW/SelH family protein [Bacillaceae bacterium]|nr:SelT/SelW/SelH family protein [Bacillaceae bacterium]